MLKCVEWTIILSFACIALYMNWGVEGTILLINLSS